MSKLCKELDFKFIGLETKIEAKLSKVAEVYKDEITNRKILMIKLFFIIEDFLLKKNPINSK